jgi:hypothetical protein
MSQAPWQVQQQVQEEQLAWGPSSSKAQFTRFTSTKVQILTQSLGGRLLRVVCTLISQAQAPQQVQVQQQVQEEQERP